MERKVAALNAREMPTPVPEWIVLVPAGDEVEGMDGRRFRSPGAAALLAEQARRGLKLPVDLNHGTQLARGQDAPAYGWISEFREQAGAVEGRLEMTDEGTALLSSKKYRYYSPAYSLEWDDPHAPPRLVAVDSIGLCNVPNLTNLTQLNAPQENPMKAIAKALGLAETATEAECLVALNARGTDVVPKADLDQALERAQKAERQLADRDAAELRRAAEVAVNSGVSSGVIAPASREFWLGLCTTPEGLNNVKSHLASAPKIVTAAPTGPTGDPPGGSDDGSGTAPANEDERHVFRQLGIDEESS